MTLPKGITVTIITLNEEAHIRACLESVRWADEIIVSDSGSADSTAAICREFGARVFADEWRGYGAQKNLCQDRASNPWIFNIDADERATPELAAEAAEAAARGKADGYYVPRKNHFGGRWVRRCGWYPDYTLRLYRKDAGRFAERKVHEAVRVAGATGRLKNPLTHLTYDGVSDYLERMQKYSTLAAEEMAREGREASFADILLRPAFTFVKMYLLQLGFLEGALGAELSYLYASYTLSKYAKLRELNAGRGGGRGAGR